MKAIIAVCCLFFVGISYAKSISDVADCFHGKLRECKEKCKTSLPEEQREAVGQCWKAEAESSRASIRTCLEGKGVDRSSACFKVDHGAHMKSMASGATKFSEPVREALKSSVVCFKQCLEEKKTEVEACQEGCGDGDQATKDKLHECTQEAKEHFPSETLKSCLNTALHIH